MQWIALMLLLMCAQDCLPGWTLPSSHPVTQRVSWSRSPSLEPTVRPGLWVWKGVELERMGGEHVQWLLDHWCSSEVAQVFDDTLMIEHGDEALAFQKAYWMYWNDLGTLQVMRAHRCQWARHSVLVVIATCNPKRRAVSQSRVSFCQLGTTYW